MGTGRSCYETLRPLAYSLLAELIHHVRIDLSLQQLSRIIYLFSKNVHDHSLPLSVQTTCVRLMLNLVRVFRFGCGYLDNVYGVYFLSKYRLPSTEERARPLGTALGANNQRAAHAQPGETRLKSILQNVFQVRMRRIG